MATFMFNGPSTIKSNRSGAVRINLLGLIDEGSMILPVLERIKGRVKGCGGCAEVFVDLGDGDVVEAASGGTLG